MNLILVSLPGIELYQLACYIRAGTMLRYANLKLNLSLESNCFSLWKIIKENNLPVNMLINNAGIGGTRDFSETDFNIWQKHIQLNITGMVYLTHLLLPELKKHRIHIY